MEAPAAGLGGIEELEVLLLICSLLASAKDYLSLRLTCRRFDAKIIAAPSGGTAAAGGGGSTAAAGGGGIAAAEPEMLCIVDEAARRWVAQHSERWVVSRRALESWLGLMHRGPPLVFGRAHDTFTLSENGVVATINADHEKWEGKIAASTAVMHSGRHFAQFTMLAGCPVPMQMQCPDKYPMFGVIQPGRTLSSKWRDEMAMEHEPGDRFYHGYFGGDVPRKIFSPPRFQQTHAHQGDRIGMLLDLDQGSMTVWKNDAKLGVMIASGLTGPLCWAASITYGGQSVRVDPAPEGRAPASPTEAELAAIAEEIRAALISLMHD
jgi:hypothetical protein